MAYMVTRRHIHRKHLFSKKIDFLFPAFSTVNRSIFMQYYGNANYERWRVNILISKENPVHGSTSQLLKVKVFPGHEKAFYRSGGQRTCVCLWKRGSDNIA